MGALPNANTVVTKKSEGPQESQSLIREIETVADEMTTCFNVIISASAVNANRPWHDRAITRANQEKEAWAGDEKPAQRQSCVGRYRPRKIVNSSSRIHVN